jgi:hypothetical protein
MSKKRPNLEEKKIELELQRNKSFNMLVSQGLPLLEKYFTSKLEKIEAPKFKWTLIIFGSLLTISVVGTGILVYADKVDSANFTFLLGIMIGSIVTLIGDIIFEAKG